MTLNDTILKEDKSFVWHPFTQMQTASDPLVIIEAKDSTLHTSDGKKYLDCNSSWWVNIHGHGHPHLKQALIQQFDLIDHVIFAGATHPKAVELARRVVGLLPSKLEKVFFSDDGSTSVEVALKMVFQYWFNKEIPKKRIVALDGAYHGDTFGAMSISQRGCFNEPFEHLFFAVDYLDFPFLENEASVLSMADHLFSKGDCAALILEPLIQGSAGMRIYSASFLEELVNIASKYDVLVVFDEVMTGWGRTGELFACNHLSVQPDIICLSKGLTGGVLPLGLTVATNSIYDAFLAPEKTKALLHGHSFTGNALACALACANIDLIEKNSFQESINRISLAHSNFLITLKGNLAVRTSQLGTILVIEILEENTSSYFSSIRDRAYQFFLDLGLLIRPLGNIVFLNPPYCMSNIELEKCYSGIQLFLNVLAEERTSKTK